jgi:hypothetical protein
VRPALAFFAAMLLLLAACGGSSTPSDPFVGTWRPVEGDASASLVIAKGSDGYEAFVVTKHLTGGPYRLQRHGDTLVYPAHNGVDGETFTFHGDSGRLTDKSGSAARGFHLELDSRSTSHPPVTSPQSSPDQSF